MSLPRLGASEVPSVMGLGPATPLEIALRKLGKIPQLFQTPQMEAGCRIEHHILDRYAEASGHITRHNCESWWNCNWLKATPDGFISSGYGGEGTAEVKNFDSSQRWAWRKGAPLRIQVQAQTQMCCTECSWGSAVVLLGGVELLYHELKRNDRWIDHMLAVTREFMADLERGQLPSPVAADCFWLAKTQEPSAKTMTLADEFVDVHLMFALAKQAEKTFGGLKDVCKAKIAQAMVVAEATEAFVPETNERYSYKANNRGSRVFLGPKK